MNESDMLSISRMVALRDKYKGQVIALSDEITEEATYTGTAIWCWPDYKAQAESGESMVMNQYVDIIEFPDRPMPNRRFATRDEAKELFNPTALPPLTKIAEHVREVMQ